MNPVVAERSAELESLCQRYSVLRLELFGSSCHRRISVGRQLDLDFLKWSLRSCRIELLGASYFGLLKSLEQMFGRSVDLVDDSSIKNPYLRESVDESKVLVYAA